MRIFTPFALLSTTVITIVLTFFVASSGATAEEKVMKDPLLALLIEVGIADASLAE